MAQHGREKLNPDMPLEKISNDCH